MSVMQPFTAAKYRAFDSNGNPLAGGTVNTYEAGTTTPLVTYTDASGGTPNANPVVLDANGEANIWLIPETLYKFVIKDVNGALQDTVDNFTSPPDLATPANPAMMDPGGRLSLQSGVPVTTSDEIGQTTVYYVPYKSDQVPLWDGAAWGLHSIGTGLSQATSDTTKSPAAVVANSAYDLYVWNDAGTIRLSRGAVWPTTTWRGTGAGSAQQQYLNGRLVNAVNISNGPAANMGLYVGSVLSNGSAQLDETLGKRHATNNYNRVRRPMAVQDILNANWNYTTAAWRQADANAANQLSVFIGVSEDAVGARVVALASNSGSGAAYVGIGLDSTTALASGCFTAGTSALGSGVIGVTAFWEGLPGLGHHVLNWLEYGGALNTTTFFASLSIEGQSGIQGWVMG